MMSVKELAGECSSSKITIPENFVCLDREQPSSVLDPAYLPTIDMNQLLSGQNKASELQKLHSACQEWGFFQLVNHGVCPSLLKQLKHDIEEFFELPLEEKMKFGVKLGEYEGYGTLVRSSDQKLDWGDRFYIITNPVHRRKPHLLPQLPPSLRNTLESYLKETRKIAMALLKLLARALKMEERRMEEMFEDGMEAMRMSYYPPCPQPKLVIGLRAHSDATGLTILNELNGVQGLQIKKDGNWFDITFIPDAFIVNVGDILQIVSNGMYSSIEHRAAVNPEKRRMSIATFFNPKFEAEIGPDVSILNAHNPPLFKRILMEDYVSQFFSSSFGGKSHLERMMLQTDGPSSAP